jgi:hypothetical protein
MSDARVPKRTRRKHRRHHKRVRNLLGTLGLISLGLGAIIAGLAVVTTRGTLLVIGACYMASGGALLLVRVGLQRSRAHSESRSQGGMALILALLLVAVLGALVMHSLSSAHVALRYAREREIRVAAQTTAVDAAWHTLHELASGAIKPGATIMWRPPSGLPAHVRVSQDRRARIHGGNLLIHSIAETNHIRHDVYCVVRRQSNGTVVPTRWIEP